MRKKALLIGVNNYPNGNELHGCVDDANELSDILERNGNGSKNFDTKRLLNVRSTLEAKQAIEELLKVTMIVPCYISLDMVL